MATFRQFLEEHRDEIVPCIYGPEGQREQSFPILVNEVVAVASSDRGRGIPFCDRRSILEAVKRAASWPVTIGAQDGAALVVTDNLVESSGKPQLIAMQTAKAKLSILHRFGGLRWHNARCVYSGELPTFVAVQGDNPGIERHDDLSFEPKRRGQLAGAYVIGLTKDDGRTPKVLELMNRFDIDTIRREFSRDLRDGDLNDIEFLAQYAMAKCVHRFCLNITIPDRCRALLDDRAPHLGDEPAMPEEGTITVPVQDPRGVLESIERPAAPETPVRFPAPFAHHAHRVRREVSRL